MPFLASGSLQYCLLHFMGLGIRGGNPAWETLQPRRPTTLGRDTVFPVGAKIRVALGARGNIRAMRIGQLGSVLNALGFE